ncbi:MAG: response regulator transcription factor [Clostridiaceae bacterium]
MYKIMIIEDDKAIRDELSITLRNNGYDVSSPCEFEDIKSKIKEENSHLILLDINLPYQDGFKLCSEVRSYSNVPIIFITSRNTDMDELMSITLGGDDFITKPYNIPVLLARISSLLKRTYSNKNTDNILSYNGVKIDLLTSNVEYKNNKVELTKTELKILHYLFENNCSIVPRMDMIEYLWDNEMFVDDNTLSVNITRIRNKLESIGVRDFIKTKRGQGYII